MQYYIIVASKDHVKIGVENGFAQGGHGKTTQLQKLKRDDWIIYYSPKDQYKNGNPCQVFTAIGQVIDDEPYQVTMSPDFKPWRRQVEYYPADEVAIEPLIDHLNFITNKKRWGMHLMGGFLEIGATDFNLIAEEMLFDRRKYLIPDY